MYGGIPLVVTILIFPARQTNLLPLRFSLFLSLHLRFFFFHIFAPPHAVGDPQVPRRLPALRVSPTTTEHSTGYRDSSDQRDSTDQRGHDPAQQTIRPLLLACYGWCRLEGGQGLGKARHQGDQAALISSVASLRIVESALLSLKLCLTVSSPHGLDMSKINLELLYRQRMFTSSRVFPPEFLFFVWIRVEERKLERRRRADS